MKALILVGGYGTRLRPLTLSVPKPLIHFCNRSIVEHQIHALVKAGVTKVILAVAYLPSRMLDAIQQLEKTYNITIVCSREEEPLGTGGPIRLAENLLRDSEEEKQEQKIERNDAEESFFVCNSDVICDFPFQKLIDTHKRTNAEGTILVTRVSDPSSYGVVMHDQNNRVSAFVEKPKNFVGDFINAGIYILKKSVIDQIYLRPTSLEKETFPALAKNGTLYCMHLDGYWADIGQPREFLIGTRLYLETLRKKNELNIKKNVCIKNGENKHLNNFNSELESLEYTPKLAVGDNIKGNVLVDKTACIGAGSVIGPNVTIGPKCEIGEGCRIANCALMEGVTVQNYSYLDHAILGWQSVVGKWVRIDGLTVIGEDVKIGNELYVNQAIVLPHKEIKESLHNPGQIIM